MRPYTEVVESTRVSRSAHAKINWIFSHADGVQCNQIGYSPCSIHASSTFPVVCPKFKCVQFDLTAIGLSPTASPSAGYPLRSLIYLFFPPTPPPLTPQHRILSKANFIELFSSYPIYT